MFEIQYIKVISELSLFIVCKDAHLLSTLLHHKMYLRHNTYLYLSSTLRLHHLSFIRLCLLLLYIIRCLWDTISNLSKLDCLLLLYIIRCVGDTIYQCYIKARLRAFTAHRLQGCAFYSFTFTLIHLRCVWDTIFNA